MPSRKQIRPEMQYTHFLEDRPARRYTLCVTLRNISPEIYRTFYAPSNITLRHLSELIMQLMGWKGYHLNAFRLGQHSYMPDYQRDIEAEQLSDSAQAYCHSQEEHTLADLLQEEGQTVDFEYDFGDGWVHEVKLILAEDYQEGDDHPVRFVSGKNACPPEDMGGPFAYQDALAILRKKEEKQTVTRAESARLKGYGISPKTFRPLFYDGEVGEDICYRFTDLPGW